MTRTQFLISGILYFVCTVVLLTLPGSAFPGNSFLGGFLEKIYFDKWVHIGMFALLSWIWIHYFLQYKKIKNTHVIIACIIAAVSAYGILMEFVQRDFVPNRSFDLYDILADIIGATLGGYLSWYMFRKKRH